MPHSQTGKDQPRAVRSSKLARQMFFGKKKAGDRFAKVQITAITPENGRALRPTQMAAPFESQREIRKTKKFCPAETKPAPFTGNGVVSPDRIVSTIEVSGHVRPKHGPGSAKQKIADKFLYLWPADHSIHERKIFLPESGNRLLYPPSRIAKCRYPGSRQASVRSDKNHHSLAGRSTQWIFSISVEASGH